MIDWLLEPFSQGIGLRALAEVVILGVACGPLGVWIVLYRQAYAAESIAHSILPGLVIAALAGIPLGLGAAAGLVVAVACIALAMRARQISPDVAVAAVVTTMIGLGSLLALAPSTPARLGELLFGDPLSVSSTELVATAVVAATVVAALAAGRRALTLVAFDPGVAGAFGFSHRRAELALLAMIGLATLAAVQALGNLLVVAILIAPAAAALVASRRIAIAMPLAAVLAALAGFAGLTLSYRIDVAAGATIAAVAVAEVAILAIVASTIDRIAGAGNPRATRRRQQAGHPRVS